MLNNFQPAAFLRQKLLLYRKGKKSYNTIQGRLETVQQLYCVEVVYIHICRYIHTYKQNQRLKILSHTFLFLYTPRNCFCFTTVLLIVGSATWDNGLKVVSVYRSFFKGTAARDFLALVFFMDLLYIYELQILRLKGFPILFRFCKVIQIFR